MKMKKLILIIVAILASPIFGFSQIMSESDLAEIKTKQNEVVSLINELQTLETHKALSTFASVKITPTLKGVTVLIVRLSAKYAIKLVVQETKVLTDLVLQLTDKMTLKSKVIAAKLTLLVGEALSKNSCYKPRRLKLQQLSVDCEIVYDEYENVIYQYDNAVSDTFSVCEHYDSAAFKVMQVDKVLKRSIYYKSSDVVVYRNTKLSHANITMEKSAFIHILRRHTVKHYVADITKPVTTFFEEQTEDQLIELIKKVIITGTVITGNPDPGGLTKYTEFRYDGIVYALRWNVVANKIHSIYPLTNK